MATSRIPEQGKSNPMAAGMACRPPDVPLEPTKMQRSTKRTVIVADASVHTRRIMSDVLRGIGFMNIVTCHDGFELLKRSEDHGPSVVITTSRLPGVSGLEYTRRIRAGFRTVPRELSIIAMTDSPTRSFLEAARDSGVDEMLVRPISARAVLTRMDAVVSRPRAFVDSIDYAGPCRRRRPAEEYGGPLRRLADPAEAEGVTALWESEDARRAARAAVRRIREFTDGLAAGDRRRLRALFEAVREAGSTAAEVRDEMTAGAARSLGQYLTGVGASDYLDLDVIHTHIDALYSLCMLGNRHGDERRRIVDGLTQVVRKRLDRQRGHARLAHAARI